MKGDKKMKRQVKRLVKGLGNSAPLEFPAAEVTAFIIWAISYSILYNRLHIVIAITLSAIIAIPFFIILKRYIKSDKSKQKEIDIDIINQFNLSTKEAVEVSLSSNYDSDAYLFQYAIKTLINMKLLKFFAELKEDGKVIVSIQDDKGNVISKRTYYTLTGFEQNYRPKENA